MKQPFKTGTWWYLPPDTAQKYIDLCASCLILFYRNVLAPTPLGRPPGLPLPKNLVIYAPAVIEGIFCRNISVDRPPPPPPATKVIDFVSLYFSGEKTGDVEDARWSCMIDALR
jgi:hypothetical protein